MNFLKTNYFAESDTDQQHLPGLSLKILCRVELSLFGALKMLPRAEWWCLAVSNISSLGRGSDNFTKG